MNNTFNAHTGNFISCGSYICGNELALHPDNDFFAQQDGNCKYNTDEVFAMETIL